MAAGENRFTRELNEKESIKPLDDLPNILGAFLIKQLFQSRLLRVGYEMIRANLALRTSLAIYHLISNARSWNNC